MGTAPLVSPAVPDVNGQGPALVTATTTTDPILFWNAIALEANRVSHSDGSKEQNGPTLSSRALAIVHLAMYDAYAAVQNDPTNLPPYLGLPLPSGIPTANSAAAAAAVAGAAHRSLSVLFPSQRPFFDAVLLQFMNQPIQPFPAARDYGIKVADKILEDRKNDPGASDAGYLPSNERGHHRDDPDNPGKGFHAPFYGNMARGFAITDRHELEPPPFMDATDPTQFDPIYLAALREVRGRGIAPQLMGTLPSTISPRTAAETVRGIFWGYDGAVDLGTPPRLYNQIVRTVAIHKGYTVTENARLFALVNVAMADAGILAWEQKYIHDFWRPVVGIREHDGSMGPNAATGTVPLSDDCDAGWLPLGAPKTNELAKNFTPPFPAYPSGHATFGAAALHMLRLFANDNTPIGDDEPDTLLDGLGFVSDEFNGVSMDNHGVVRPRHVRKFPGGLWQMIVENGLSRVDLGVHWFFDAFATKVDGSGNVVPDVTKNIGGVPLGITIAKDIYGGGRAMGMKRTDVGPLGSASMADRTAAAAPGLNLGGSWQDRIEYPPRKRNPGES